ncbi:ROK family protein [Rathayibacter soli]|uniref:ROK family protein n=1 Tax=Rathayibacter soli TaxID=3144168 RepID=UPI0027E5211C|nr:ROK family protein [Glaciibacter superstes]
MTTLCIDLGGTSAKLGVYDAGRALSSARIPVSGHPVDLETIRLAAGDLRATVDAVIDQVAVAVPGIVDQASGTLVAAHGKYTYALGMDLRSWAAQVFDVPALIENDARAALFGEVAFGVAQGHTDAVLVMLGTGIGTAAIMDGRLIRGAHDHAGVLGGHVTVDIDGPLCNCGNVGCAEAVASTWALERAIREHPEFATSDAWHRLLENGSVGILDLMSADDDIARDVLQRFVRIWGAAAVSLCHAYDPDVVVVTGGVLRTPVHVLPALTSYINTHLWSSFPRPRMLLPENPEHSVLLGLSALAESNR